MRGLEPLVSWNGQALASLGQPMKDYYAILGVSPDVDVNEIREAWRRLAFEWHPDRNTHRLEVASARFLDLSEAWAVVRDPRSRFEYDLSRPDLGARSRGEDERPTPQDPPSSPPPPGEGGWFNFSDPEPEPAELHDGVPIPKGSGPTMKEYRFAVRELAHELASADRRGRHLDLLMLTGTLFTGGAALVVTGFFLISAEVPELAPAFWMVVLAWLATVVFTAWFLSLREQRVEYYRPFAEEVLQRTGHGWRGRPASEQSEAETA